MTTADAVVIESTPLRGERARAQLARSWPVVVCSLPYGASRLRVLASHQSGLRVERLALALRSGLLSLRETERESVRGD
jgi:hypothetical protein